MSAFDSRITVKGDSQIDIGDLSQICQHNHIYESYISHKDQFLKSNVPQLCRVFIDTE